MGRLHAKVPHQQTLAEVELCALMAVACRRQTLLMFRRYTADAPSAPLRPPLHASSAPPHARLQLVSILQQRQRLFASSALLPPASSGSPRPDAGSQRFLKGLSLIIGFTGVCSLMYSTGSVWKGDIPTGHSYLPHLFIEREEEAKRLVEMIDIEKCFIVVKGYPGCGKTSLVCDVARKRGSAVYIDAASASTFADVENKVSEKYQNLYLKISYLIGRKPSSGFETLNLLSWIVRRLPGGKPLLVIVDHVHKLTAQDALRLASWAKTSTDNLSANVILIGSDLSQDLTSNSDTISRGDIFKMDHPKPQQVRDALQKYANANPERSIEIEELLYLSGCFPSLLCKLIKGQNSHMELYRPDMKYKELWYDLLISGPNGLAAGKAQESWSDAIFSLNGLICIKKTIYYKSGLHRDATAESLIEDGSAKLKMGAEFMNEQRMKEVEKAMMTRTYEAYRSSVLPPL